MTQIIKNENAVWRTDESDEIDYVDGLLRGYMYHVNAFENYLAEADDVKAILETGGVSSIRYRDPRLSGVKWQHNAQGLDYEALITKRDEAYRKADKELAKLRIVNLWLSSLDNEALDFMIDHYEMGYSITTCGQMHGMKRDTALRYWRRILLTWRDDGQYIRKDNMAA